MKKNSSKKMVFYNDYINSYHNTFSLSLFKKIAMIEVLLLKKIKEKKKYLFVVMVDLPQYQIIFCVILIKV